MEIVADFKLMKCECTLEHIKTHGNAKAHETSNHWIPMDIIHV